MEFSITIIFMLISFLSGMYFYRRTQQVKSANITSTMWENRLAECSDLTTCQLEYVDLVKYTNGNIPLFTKRSFSMIYAATLRAGIRLEDAKVTCDHQNVTIYLPPTIIQSIEVDTDSLRFYDEHFALFSWNDKEDLSQAIKMAREDVMKHANLERLKAQARQQAEAVIYQLIAPSLDKDKKLQILMSEKENSLPFSEENSL